MSHEHEQFEPFGESIGRSFGPDTKIADGSPVLRYAGATIFWALVVTIVTARVLFFFGIVAS